MNCCITPDDRTGKQQIMFLEPLEEDDFELGFFMDFFKKYKRETKIFYVKKPKFKVTGLLCGAELWVIFVAQFNVHKKIILKEIWYLMYYGSLRDRPFRSAEEFVACLKATRKAELVR